MGGVPTNPAVGGSNLPGRAIILKGLHTGVSLSHFWRREISVSVCATAISDGWSVREAAAVRCFGQAPKDWARVAQNDEWPGIAVPGAGAQQ